MHDPDEIGIDDFQAKRSPDGKYPHDPARRPVRAREGRLLPRRPLRRPGGPFVAHYERVLKLSLADAERRDLVEYLKSL
jgi:hypothetical protein